MENNLDPPTQPKKPKALGGSQEPGSDDGLGGAEMEGMQLARLGTTGGAMKEAEDPETYVDRLLAVCIEAGG